MSNGKPAMSRQVAETAIALLGRKTGHVPRVVKVVLSEDALVITLHGALL